MTDTSARGKCLFERLSHALLAPRDPSGLAVFRILFGLLGAVSAIRFLAYGWVGELFVRPKFYFSYLGFEWVRVLPPAAMYALFAGLVVVSLMVAAGLFYRVATVLFFLGFSYVQLIDVTNYLNHYYLVSLCAGLMAFLPMNAAWSLDARLFPGKRRASVPAYAVYLLRFQIAVVYTFAGLAKVNVDWLVHGQPLGVWLAARTGLPVIGPLFALPGAALVMSWAGCLFDLTIAAWLSIPRTRLPAYAVVLFFHVVTSALFPIGMFPVIMVTAALVFFPPSWPRDLVAWARRVGARAGTLVLRRPSEGTLVLRGEGEGTLVLREETTSAQPPSSAAPAGPPPRWVAPALAAFAVFAIFQVAFPFRAHLYGGNVHWHEQGMRWSWRVMVREKNAGVTYRVTNPVTGKITEVAPRKYLTARQGRDFATQPDLLLQLGKRIAKDYSAREGVPVTVHVDAIVSLNGRRAARLVDPTVDLARVDDGLGKATWILPMPEEAPPRLTPVAMR
jgi:vitamin K-dependent gamma-carboxylase